MSKEPHQAAQEKEAKMYPSTYFSWFRRLLILGAVVAGLTASAAGARLDPGTPSDVSDVASALSMPASIVSRPPDVRDAATSVKVAAPDVFERYAAAHPYGFDLNFSELVSSPPDGQDAMTALHSTPEGLKADGLRLQGIARTYMQLQSQDAVSQNTTPAGLKADGLRDQGIAQVYKSLQSDSTPVRPDDRAGPLGVGEPASVPVSGGSDFAWNDWAIGVGAGIGIALLLGVGLIVGRQQRHRVQPA